MGNKPPNSTKLGGPSDKAALEKQYQPSFLKFKDNPEFLKQLLVQNTCFAENLTFMFPDAHKTFQGYFEMVMYLRREDSTFAVTSIAVKNAPNTTLLDRFFMVILGIHEYQNYETLECGAEELDNLLINYFKLFIENPEKGTIQKLMKFMKIETPKIKIKQFASIFRQYFPHVQKYLKDYYLLKFNKMQQNGRLTKTFFSKIIKNDIVLLALKIPRLVNPEIVELYNTQNHGLGFHSIERRLIGYSGPWMMLIQHVQKNEKGEKQTYVLGTYQNGPIRNVSVYQGDLTGFMFAISPNIKFFTSDKGEGGNHYFYINSLPEEKTKKRKGFGFGGNSDKQHFKLWLDEDLERSTIFNGKDPTYGYGSLASSGTNKLNIRRIEIWGLGSQFDIEEQAKYWKQRQQEIMKRRKVDKRQFVDNNAGLFFQKAFAHRDQIQGEIQKKKQNE